MARQLRAWPTICALITFIILMSLGGWQLHRLQWKETLIERLQERDKAESVRLPSIINNEEDYEFRKIFVSGEFMHDKEFFLVNRSLRGKPGLNVVTVLKRTDGEGYVLINRGWIPFQNREPATRRKGQVRGPIKIEGIVRLAKGPSAFTPKNEPHNNTWFYIDPVGMAASIGLPPFQSHYVLSANSYAGGFPLGHQWRVDLKNDHLQYAITWFCLALALVVVFIVYHCQPEDSPN